MVEKENFDGASVVLINNPHANINHVFSCEERSESNATICFKRDSEGNANIDEGLAVSGDDLILQSGKIMAGGLGE